MKIQCKKCLITHDDDNMTFHDVEIYSTLQCGAGGNHEFRGCA